MTLASQFHYQPEWLLVAQDTGASGAGDVLDTSIEATIVTFDHRQVGATLWIGQQMTP